MKRLVSIIVLGVLIGGAAKGQYPGQYTERQSAKEAVPVKVVGFDLQDVRLLDSRFKENMKRDGRTLLELNSGRLLHSWRVNAGIHSYARPLGSWESLDCELRGHIMGHVLSGLSMMYASTGDSAFKKKADTLVDALAECQEALHQGGYLSAFSQHEIDRVIAGKPVWAPWYTIHKIMAGLVDAYLYTGNKKGLDIAEKMSAWALGRLDTLSAAQLATMEKNEFGGMIEVAYNLYAITGNAADKRLAERFYDHAVFDPLLAGEDRLAGLHANTQIPKMIGEARGYEMTGDEKAEAIAKNFWQTVIDHHTYATGGNSDDEHFFAADQLSKHLSPVTTETCNTYNMLKLTRHLFAWSADARYMDYYERALYNHILGSQDLETGAVSYFMPFKPGFFKYYNQPDAFWCCVGTGFESHAKYGESIYGHDGKGLYVNLFIPSVVRWKEKSFELRQETKYPEEEGTHLFVERGGPLLLYIRYPGWAVNGVSVSVNGKTVKVTAKPGSYIGLERNWKQGDEVTVRYPMGLRVVAANDDPAVAAVAYGPVVLAGEMGSEGLSAGAPLAHETKDFAGTPVPADIRNTLTVRGRNPADWLKPVAGKPLEFTTAGLAGAPIPFVPYYSIARGRYVIYWNLNQAANADHTKTSK
jgi:DUF1680 family protein